MKLEKYQPTIEEIEKAKDMMSPEEDALTQYREKFFKDRSEKGFIAINSDILNSDLELKAFLLDARFSKSKRGDGVFISGARGIDTAKFRKYGIPVTGALIIPTKNNPELEIEIITSAVENLRESLAKEKQKKEDDEKKINQAIADEEFNKRIEALQPMICEFEKIADEYKDSLGAQFITGEDGGIELRAGKFKFSVLPVTTDYDLPENIRNLRKMPKPEWVHKRPEEVREFLNSEIKISPNRKRLLPIVDEIEGKLHEEFSESSGGKQNYVKLLLNELKINGRNLESHEINFMGQSYEWSDDGVEKLKHAVDAAAEKIREIDRKAWEDLRLIDIKNIRLENPYHRDSSVTSLLKIGDSSIDFGTPKSALAAYKWVLEQKWTTENNNMTLDELEVKEAIENGAGIKKIETGVGHSPDHMRQITSYAYVVGDKNIGDPGSPLHEFAARLIKEKMAPLIKEMEERRQKEMEKMKIRIKIYFRQSRTKGNEIIVEGLFHNAINEAIKKVRDHGDPRRGYNIWITRLLDDQKEGYTKDEEAFLENGKASDVIEYFKNLNKEEIYH